MMFRLVLDTMQSPVAVQAMVEHGLHNPARRELRFVLESALKYLHVDEQLPDAAIQDKLDFLHKHVPRSSVSVVDDTVFSLPAHMRAEYRAEVKNVFGLLSGYTHPSRSQIEAYLRAFDQGIWPGNESASQAWEMARLAFRVYDLVLVAFFTGVGPGMAGDIFVHLLDDGTDWKFHKGKFVSEHSKLHDTKFEREERARAPAG